jgi:UDP-N-acetylmuramyl tripeptide synthase
VNILAAVADVGVNGEVDPLMEKVWNFQGAPGWLERITNVINASIFVYYANMEDVLINLLSALKSLTKNKLIVVFGCGRDLYRFKSPKMIRMILIYHDMVIVTANNSKNETIETNFLT